MENCSKVTAHVTVIILVKIAPELRIVGAKVSHSLKSRGRVAQILCELFAQSSKISYASKCTRVRNDVIVTWTVIVTPTTVPEGAGWIEPGNYIYVRNVN